MNKPPTGICRYSWGFQYNPDDFSDYHECELPVGHTGPHVADGEQYDPVESAQGEPTTTSDINKLAELLALGRAARFKITTGYELKDYMRRQYESEAKATIHQLILKAQQRVLEQAVDAIVDQREDYDCAAIVRLISTGLQSELERSKG